MGDSDQATGDALIADLNAAGVSASTF